MTHRQKIEFLKNHGICFACLKFGHLSKDCTNRQMCDMCSQKHPTILHISAKGKTIEEKQVSNALVTLKTYAHIGAYQDCFLSIVPVQVKSKLGDFTVTTYAFLDPGSILRSIGVERPNKASVERGFEERDGVETQAHGL